MSGQAVQFSPNLNCIIGGRGTGKSTAFEAVRCLVGNPTESSVVDSEVWPDELHLCWQDQAGQQHTLFRPKDGEFENVDDPEFGPSSFDVDCFGQGEAAKISLEAQTNPLALLNYLDKFVERLLATTQQQLAALQKPEVKELIELQRQLASERELRTQILAKIQEAKDDLERGSPKAAIEEILGLAEPADVRVGAKEFRVILEGAIAFEQAVGAAETQIKVGLTGFEKLVAGQIGGWKAKEVEAQKRIDAKRRELEALKVSFDMSYISKLAKDEASHQQNVRNLKAWQPHLIEVRIRRSVVLKERWTARDRIATIRETFGRRATATLREALSDLQVILKYARNAYSPDAANLIIQVMGWRTNQQPRANWLVEKLTIPVLLDAIQRKDVSPILAIKTPEDVLRHDRGSLSAPPRG
jgi:hypothetical protein